MVPAVRFITLKTRCRMRDAASGGRITGESPRRCIRNCRISHCRDKQLTERKTNRCASSDIFVGAESAQIVSARRATINRSARIGAEIAEIVSVPGTFFSSRCARTGVTTPTATGKWDWNSPKNNQAMAKQ